MEDATFVKALQLHKRGDAKAAEQRYDSCWPVQMTSSPDPGMNPAGISARVQKATSSNAASAGFLAHLIAVGFLTQSAYWSGRNAADTSRLGSR